MSLVFGIVVAIMSIISMICLLWLKKTNYHFDGLKSLNGPYTYPIIGGLLELLPPTQTLWKLHELHQKYGKTFKMAVPYTVGIFTMEPDFIEFIMTRTFCMNKSLMYRFLRNWLGDGLLLSESDKWRKRRKLITPTFHFKILEEFIDVFNKNERILIHQLHKAAEKQSPVNLFHYATLCALDNINETAMGTSVDAQINEHSEFVKATKCMTGLFFSRAVSPHKFLDILYALTADARMEKKCLRVLHSYTMSVIKARREELLSNIKRDDHQSDSNTTRVDGNDNFGMKHRSALLDLLLQSTIDGQPLSNEDIREEVDTFMFEGHDTISAAISFTLHCISKHLNVQAKVIKEQREIYGEDPTRDTTLEDMKSMFYLEMVIKESLRLFPSVPVIARVAMEDFHYRDLHIRKGTELLMPFYAVHKDPELFPHQEKFEPERFTTENQNKRHPFAYLPFSAGHRNCIGQKFAMLEMKSMISRVLRHFELNETKPAHKLVLPSAVVLQSSTGVFINIKNRVW